MGGAEIHVEDDNFGSQLQRFYKGILELAFAEDSFRIGAATLKDCVHDIDAGAGGEFLQLLHGLLRFGAVSLGHVDDEGALPTVSRGARGAVSRELFLKCGNDREKIFRKVMDPLRGENLPRGSGFVVRQEVGGVYGAWKAIGLHVKGGDEVQPEKGQIGEVVVVESTAVKMGMHQAKTAQTVAA